MVRWGDNGALGEELLEAVYKRRHPPCFGCTQSPEDRPHQRIALAVPDYSSFCSTWLHKYCSATRSQSMLHWSGTAAAQHMEENLEAYLTGKFTAGERRVLLTQWVGQAWEIRSFKKCGISTAADGSHTRMQDKPWFPRISRPCT